MQTARVNKDVLTAIHERKSVRHYTGEPVSKKEIETIIHAGMAAPTAVHMMPWTFLVVRDQNTLKLLSAGLPFAKMLEQAGSAIVVCVSPERAALGKEEFAVLDGACASENILLAAEALGLGAVWTAVYPDKELMAHVRSLLGIPPNVIPLNVIPVGHSAGIDQPKGKFNAKAIQWEYWSAKSHN